MTVGEIIAALSLRAAKGYDYYFISKEVKSMEVDSIGRLNITLKDNKHVILNKEGIEVPGLGGK